MLKETAEKRLSAIREYTDLGSGFKIAMRDLELRGAGNLLGAEQHGHMNAVGYDLYCKMLSEAVKEAKGIHTMEDFETTIDLNMDAFIPDSYISNEYQKLDIYKRIAGIETQQDYDDMLEELLLLQEPKLVANSKLFFQNHLPKPHLSESWRKLPGTICPNQQKFLQRKAHNSHFFLGQNIGFFYQNASRELKGQSPFYCEFLPIL